MIAKLVDKSVESLIAECDSAVDEVVDLLAEMPLAEEKSKKELYLAIAAILASLQKYARSWADTTLQGAYDYSTRQAELRLDEFEVNQDVLPVEIVSGLQELNTLFEEEVRTALASVESLAAALSRNRGLSKFVDPKTVMAVLAGTATAVTIASMRRQLRKNVGDKLVTVIGKDGRAYTYSLQYYTKLVATNKVTRALTQATLDQATKVGWDLLRVSPQPSTIGDFCDAYRGKVVSISATHPTYPSIGVLPNGGAPFHPNCYHFMELFMDGMEETGAISNEFLELAATGNPSPNDFQRVWKQSHK